LVTKTLSRGFVLSQSTFHLVLLYGTARFNCSYYLTNSFTCGVRRRFSSTKPEFELYFMYCPSI